MSPAHCTVALYTPPSSLCESLFLFRAIHIWNLNSKKYNLSFLCSLSPTWILKMWKPRGRRGCFDFICPLSWCWQSSHLFLPQVFLPIPSLSSLFAFLSPSFPPQFPPSWWAVVSWWVHLIPTLLIAHNARMRQHHLLRSFFQISTFILTFVGFNMGVWYSEKGEAVDEQMTGLDEDLQSTSQRLEQMTMVGSFRTEKAEKHHNVGALGVEDEKWPHPNFSPTAIQPKFIPQSPSLPSSFSCSCGK